MTAHDTMRPMYRGVPEADLPPATGTRPTTLDEFLLDLNDLSLPGTDAGPEPLPGEPDYRAKCAAWEAAGGFGHSRRGLVAEDMGAFGEGNVNADHPAPGFTLIDREGRVVMRGQYASSRMAPGVYRALRDLLDAVDPLPDYTADDLRRNEERDKAELREIRRPRRQPSHRSHAKRGRTDSLSASEGSRRGRSR